MEKVSDAILFGLEQQHLAQAQSGHWLEPKASAAFQRLQQAAQAAGFALTIASGFRSFERQLAIWNAKFTGQRPVLDQHDQPVDLSQLNEWQRCQAILLYSALPGASRHHWGTDIDVYDAKQISSAQLQLVASEYTGSGPCAPLSQWLQQQAEQFGFFLPYQYDQGGVACEPWHLSYRPLAEQWLSQLSPARLAQQLAATEIAGKQALLANIDLIFSRYVYNINDQS